MSGEGLAARREARRYPQLADQVRCSTGYTHAPGGVVRALSARGAATSAPTAFGALHALLRKIADAGEVLPAPEELIGRLGSGWGERKLGEVLRRLEAAGAIAGFVGWPGHYPKAWAIRIVDTGQVVRNAFCPEHVRP